MHKEITMEDFLIELSLVEYATNESMQQYHGNHLIILFCSDVKLIW